MNRIGTYGAIGLSAIAVIIILDTALGLGGSRWIACPFLTNPHDDITVVPMAPVDIQTIPLIALGLAISVSVIGFLSLDLHRATMGRSVPDNTERAGILSAIVLVAAAIGKTSRAEIANTFRIVTRHALDDNLLELTFARFNDLVGADLDQMTVQPMPTPIGRRRVVAASLLMGHGAIGVDRIEGLIERIAVQTGASVEDCHAVRSAVDAWQADCPDAIGVPLVALLRDRPLMRRPA